MVTIYHFHAARQPFCQLRKNVQLRLSKHGDVVIKTQAECLATYLSFWLLS